MKAIFSDIFRKNIVDIGNTVKLTHYRVGRFSKNEDYKNYSTGNINNLSEFYNLNSIWYKPKNELSISLNLEEVIEKDSIIGEPDKDDRNVIYIYFSDISNNLIGIAITLLGDNLSHFINKYEADKLYLCYSNNRNNLNHILITFPEDTLANIVVNNDKEFLENSSEISGINTFLAKENIIKETNYLTKNSFCKYIQHEISSLNENISSLNKNGAKVYKKIDYKHYKKVFIEPLNIIGEDNSEYFISDGSSVVVKGYCIYDLYSNIDGKLKLLEENKKEDLTDVVLVNKKDEDNYLTTGSDFNIDQSQKKITFRKTNKILRKTFLGIISFKSELEDGKIINIKSNELVFNVYLNLFIKYSTKFLQKDDLGVEHPVLLFNNTTSDIGWDPVNNSNRSGEIKILSDLKVPVGKIKLESENKSLFSKFFRYEILEPIYKESIDKFEYTVRIVTKLNNNSNSVYPIDDSGKETLILNKIVIDNSEISNAEFYCIQRLVSPVELKKFDEFTNNWEDSIDNIIFQGGYGVKSSANYYVTNYIPGYSNWEIKNIDTVDNNSLLIEHIDNSVVEENKYQGKSIKFHCKYGSNIARGEDGFVKPINFGKFEISRVNSNTNGYDPFNWRDVVYCNKDNNAIINLTIYNKEGSVYSSVSKTKESLSNFYTDDKDEDKTNYRLLLFDRSGKTQHEISYTNSSLGGSQYEELLKITPSNEELFNKFFTVNTFLDTIDHSNVTNIVSFRSKPLSDNLSPLDWYPKDENQVDIPIKVVISNTRGLSLETIYLAIKPNLKDTIRFNKAYDKFEEIDSIKFSNSNEEIERNELLYISSNKGNMKEFPYWEILSKDPEIKLTIGNNMMNTSYSYRLITDEDPTRYKENNEPITILSTVSKPSTTLDLKTDPLVIKRAPKQYFSKLSGFLDWKNQLTTSSIKKLDITLEGIKPTNTLKVFKLDSLGDDLVEIPDEGYLNLDYIGLYKLYIKSNCKFRIIIENFEDRNFYFFNINDNTIDKNSTFLEEGTFNNTIGKEVYFAFTGGEKDSFKSSSQVLKSFLRIINLEDNTSTIVKLRRIYENTYTTLKNLNNPEKFEIFFTNIGRNSIDYFSNLDTTLEFFDIINFGGYHVESNQIILDKDSICLDENLFNELISVDKTGLNNIKSRGYIKNKCDIILASAINAGVKYPLTPFGFIDFNISEDPNYKSVKDLNKLYLYYLLPTPKAILNVNSDIKISSFKLSKIDFNITYPSDCITEIYVSNKDGEFESITEDVEEKFEKFNITLRKRYLNESEVTIQENSGKDYNNTNNEIIGYLKIKTYIHHEKFIVGYYDSIPSKYRQEEVNKLVKPREELYTIIRLCPEESVSSITPINGETISYLGGDKLFITGIKSGNIVDTDAYFDEFKSYVNSINTIDNNRLSVNYKDRLTRVSYKEPIYLNYRHDYVGSWYLDQETLNKLNIVGGLKLDSNISIKAGLEKITSNNIIQNPWPYGLRVEDILYLGNNNKPIICPIQWNDTSVEINAAVVKFPKEYKSLENINNNISKLDNAVLTRLEGKTITREENESYGFNSYIGLEGKSYYIDNIDNNLSNSDKIIAKYKISDVNNLNSVEVDFVQYKRNYFDLFFFKDLPEPNEDGVLIIDTNLYPKPENLIFSASGKLRTTLYYATNAPEDSYNLSYSSMVESLESDSLDYVYANVVDNCYEELIGNAYINNAKEVYRVYKCNLYTKIDSYYYDLPNIDKTNSFGHLPAKGYSEIHLSSITDPDGSYMSSEVEFHNYLGSANIELKGPFRSYLSVDSTNETESEIFYSFSEFTENKGIDTEELSKYQGSLFLSNLKDELKTVKIDDTCYVTYKESSPNKYFRENFNNPSENLWDRFGYYCGFKIKATRKEWEEDSEGNLTIRESDAFRLSGNSGLNLIFPRPITKTQHKDHLMSKDQADNPEDIEIITYYDSNYYYGTDFTRLPVSGNGKIEDFSSSNSLGLILQYNKGMFKKEKGISTTIYSLNTSIKVEGNSEAVPESIHDPIYYYDPVVFKINLNLIIPNSL